MRGQADGCVELSVERHRRRRRRHRAMAGRARLPPVYRAGRPCACPARQPAAAAGTEGRVVEPGRSGFRACRAALSAISGAAADARCSISIPIFIARSSSAAANALERSGSIPASSRRCGWSRRRDAGRGSAWRARATRASRLGSGFASASATIWSICDECPVLEPALFALVGELRRLALDLLPPGGDGEATLTRTDSGIDLLLEALEPPGLGALRSPGAARRRTAILPASSGGRPAWKSRWSSAARCGCCCRGSPSRSRPAPFCRRAKPPSASSSTRSLPGSVRVAQRSIFLPGSAPSLALWLAGIGPVHAVEGDARAAAALARAAADVRGLTVERRDLARDPLPAEMLALYAAAVFDPPRAGAARQAAALAASRSTPWSPSPAIPRPSPATPPG